MTHLFSPTIHGVILIVDRCVEPVTPHRSSRGGILQMPVLLQAPLNQDGQNQHYEEGPSAHGARGGLCSNHNQKKNHNQGKKTSRVNKRVKRKWRNLCIFAVSVHICWTSLIHCHITKINDNFRHLLIKKPHVTYIICHSRVLRSSSVLFHVGNLI